MTSSVESGDFNKTVANQLNLPIGGEYPVVLVVKKNASILRNVLGWVSDVEGRTDTVTGRTVIPDVRLLMIDDEADNASINTSKIAAAGDPDTDPTKINGVIREILEAFDHSSYVGYTATPFANIYSQPDGRHDKYGEDIFPRSFIENLQAPSNYSGPARFFGVGSEDEGPLPVHRRIDDSDPWVPPAHKKDWTPGRVPSSLVEALHAFILSGAARRARGQGSAHHSMLIHVTRFQDVQGRISEQVRDEVMALRDRLRYGDGERADNLLDVLRVLWERDFVRTTAKFDAEAAPALRWEDIERHLLPVADKIQLRTMNGAARDALEYYENRAHGLTVIAIGGDKLSRGLTLEGLTVSYYLRASKMYDTLMQMGRWFGYRPRYEDLCRLYTTKELYDWYREITIDTEELRADFDQMIAEGYDPESYGLRVRQSQIGLSVTAANKMRRATSVRLSFSGKMAETTQVDVRLESLQANLGALESLVAACERHVPGRWKADGRGLITWSGLSGTVISDFLGAYRGDNKAWRVRPNFIADYIRQCVVLGELQRCTVAVVDSRQPGASTHRVLGRDLALTERTLLVTDNAQAELAREARYTVRRLVSPSHELVDLSESQKEMALKATRELYRREPPRVGGKSAADLTTPSGPEIRKQRTPDQGLLVIYLLDHEKPGAKPTESGGKAPTGKVAQPMVGFAVSLPRSPSNQGADYQVNEVWQQQYFTNPDADSE